MPQLSQQNVGPTLPESEPLDRNAAETNPFVERGPDAQTVSVVDGTRYLRTPPPFGSLQFPEQAPAAAIDRDPSTAWVADRLAPRESWWMEIGLSKPLDVPYVDVLPLSGNHGVVKSVEVNGVRAPVGRGWTRIRVDQKQASRIRLRVAEVDQPEVGKGSGGGVRELRVPGLRPRHYLRSPIIAGRALAGRDLRRVGLTYLFERTTGDTPFQRDRVTASPTLAEYADRGDSERLLDRVVFAPAARSYALESWVNPDLKASDSTLDRLVGVSGAARFESSSRFHDLPRYRASSAFDGRADTGWVGLWVRPDAPPPWISWSTPQARTVTRLRLEPAAGALRRPTRVRLSWDGAATPPLPVAPDGGVELPEPVRARSFRLTILDARFPPGTTARQRAVRAVGIGSLEVPGLAPVEVPRSGALDLPCGTVRVRVGGRAAQMRVAGTVADFDRGRPLRARGCARARMGTSLQRVTALPGPFSVDLLRLSSPAREPASAAGGGRVVDPGELGRSSVDGVRLALDGPSWLVLGQSFNKGWRASCDGRPLGEPRVVDAYANGWRVPASCRSASFTFDPQNGARSSYRISALVCGLILLFMLVAWLLGKRVRQEEPSREPIPEPTPRGMPLVAALAISAAVTVPLMLWFALRMGVVIGPVLAYVLWRGIGPRPLIAGAAFLLVVVVPLMYLIIGPTNQGGYSFGYSNSLLLVHWVAITALFLLALAAMRMLGAARGRYSR